VTQDLVDSEIVLTHWTGPDGARLEEISLLLRETEVCASTPSGDLQPYSQEYEGYMGNWGNTLDRWYHRAAVVVWPRERAFANRAETSRAWALDQIAAMASSADVAGARAAAATLAPFWDVALGKRGPDRRGRRPRSRRPAVLRPTATGHSLRQHPGGHRAPRIRRPTRYHHRHRRRLGLGGGGPARPAVRDDGRTRVAGGYAAA
jgi:hypothetical protein